MPNVRTMNKQKYSTTATNIAHCLLDLGSITFNVQNPYKWVSGIYSPVYCDNRKINSDVNIRNIVVDEFVNLIEKDFPNVNIIAGVATGGIPIGILIADRMGLPFVYVRQEPKKHGLMQQVEGVFEVGDNIVLIEDHVSTGKSSLKAIKGIRNAGLNLLSLISIMTYGFEVANDLFDKEQIHHTSLGNLDAIVNVAQIRGDITTQEGDSILSFRNNPNAWIQQSEEKKLSKFNQTLKKTLKKPGRK